MERINKIPELNSQFKTALGQAGFPVGDIVSDITVAQENKQNVTSVIRRWTGLPGSEIRQAFKNTDRDEISPIINAAITTALQPWIETSVAEGLPRITITELSRTTGLSPERLVGILATYPFSFAINGSRFITEINKPEFPKRRLKLTDSKSYGLAAQRVTRAARYLSRNPGGGPVQKAGFQEQRVDSVIKKGAWGKLYLTFTQLNSNKQSDEMTETSRSRSELGAEKDMFSAWRAITTLSETRSEYSEVTMQRLFAARKTQIPLTLFVPWGVRPQGSLNQNEITVLEKIQNLQTVLTKRSIPTQVIIMPADIYATEVNNLVGSNQADEYFKQVTKVAEDSFSFTVKPWSEIRAENFDSYQKRANELTETKIRNLLSERKIIDAFAAASRRSGYDTPEGIEKAAFAYLRERICEAEIIDKIYEPVKVSVVPKKRDNEVDATLPRIYIIPDNQQFPWLK